MSNPYVPLHVLVVDDDPMIADSLVRVLRMHDHDAVAMYSGEEALAHAGMTRPDAVISDIHLGGLNGADLVRILAQKYPACRMLLFTGYLEVEELLRAAANEGFFPNVLNKPVPPQEMLKFLAACGAVSC